MSYEQKLLEFLSIDDLQKFYSNNDMLFKDGTSVACWFRANQLRIFNGKDNQSKLVKSQHMEYKKLMIDKQEEKRKALYEKRLIEFSKMISLNKFSRNFNIKFEDGTLTYYWFLANKEKIFNSKDEYSKLIKKQYDEFTARVPLKRQETWDVNYQQKLIEFSEIMDSRKFTRCDEIKFSDNKVASYWFFANKEKIFDDKDEYSKAIVLQYNEFQRTTSKSVEQIYEEKLEYFSKIEGLSKFSHTCYQTFPDGTSCYSWFISNKKEILQGKSYNHLLVILQYDAFEKDRQNKDLEYKKNCVDITSSKKKYVDEFLSIDDMSKFEYGSSFKLSNGEFAYIWFAKNLKYILDSKDNNCIKIREQYEVILNKRRIKNALEFKKDEIYFIKLNDITKFNIYSACRLPSGIESGVWFKSNYEFIRKSKGPMEKQIKNQYRSYLAYFRLVKEFYEIKDLSKFEDYSIFRFSTGAPMDLWWESNKEQILNNDFFLYTYIKEQYEKYLSLNGTAKKLEKK